MLIFNGESKPIILDSIFAPVTSDYFWALDLSMKDFTLTPLHTLEQIVCPTFRVRVMGFEFMVPASWNILVCDAETSQLDTVELAEAAGREFTALVYGPTRSRHSKEVVTVVDYQIGYVNVTPSLSKQQMLCHAIGPNEWVNISPSDVYSKYLKDQDISDIIGG